MKQIWEMTASEMAAAIRSGGLSALDATEAHLERQAAVNPGINAIVQSFPEEARAAARDIDAAVARGEDPGPLCGVPVTIKVNVDQSGHATTNGLRLQADLIARSDSPVVANFRKAGAVIVGRTNTPAFSLRWFTKNGLHGQTLNPRNREITPGGSSGGASAAVAAGLCAIGHGTDIAGSIRYPAYACGLHGLRPSFGRVPAYNASAADRFVGAQVMAVSGPICRSIADLGLALAAMSGFDARDPWYVPAPLEGDATPRRVALAVSPEGMVVCEEVRSALTEAARALAASGWSVEEVDCPPLGAAAEINARLWMAETRYSAADMVARESDPDAMFVYEQMKRLAGPINLDTVMKDLQTRAGLVRQWELFLQENPLLLCPVSGELPFDQQRDVRSEEDFVQVYDAQLTQRALPAIGVPCLSVATDETNGRPVGVQLVAARFREDILLAAGADIEKATRKPEVATPDWHA